MTSLGGECVAEMTEERPLETRQAARSTLFGFIEGFYNRTRLHLAIGYKDPTDMEQLAAAA
jgi:transposase InsO family protein